MREQAELQYFTVRVNGDHTFLLDEVSTPAPSLPPSRMTQSSASSPQRTLRSFCGRLARENGAVVEFADFPGGPEGFELAARFCYNRGKARISPANVCVLHCAARVLDMAEELFPCNLLAQAETFLDGLFYWTWHELLSALRSCAAFFPHADAGGLLERLTSSLLAKISASSETPVAACATPLHSSPSSHSSPEAGRHCVAREWWFDDLTALHPEIIGKIMRVLGAYGADNRNLVLTRFLLHYLRTAASRGGARQGEAYSALADTAVHGVVSTGRSAFSCRGLFWVLRVVSYMGLAPDCRRKLESLMGSMLDPATLDDLLVSGHQEAVYDVELVLRLVRIFVGDELGSVSTSPATLRKVGWLLDKYLREISPDQSLKAAKFQSLAESLPDSARECFDGVYRALDIYLEAHPGLSVEERARLCRCLNYEKLSPEACRELAKNPRVPPRAAMRALLASRRPRSEAPEAPRTAVHRRDREELKASLERMHRRVGELERTCREMQGRMSSRMGPKADAQRMQQRPRQAGKGITRLC